MKCSNGCSNAAKLPFGNFQFSTLRPEITHTAFDRGPPGGTSTSASREVEQQASPQPTPPTRPATVSWTYEQDPHGSTTLADLGPGQGDGRPPADYRRHRNERVLLSAAFPGGSPSGSVPTPAVGSVATAVSCRGARAARFRSHASKDGTPQWKCSTRAFSAEARE